MFCTEEQRKDCRVEKMGCEGCFYNLEGPMEEYLKCYDELKRNKHIFKTIEPDFFFKFTEYLINKNKQLQEENQRLMAGVRKQIGENEKLNEQNELIKALSGIERIIK